MGDAYFTTDDGVFFRPTPFTRGPWDLYACHAGPPTALMARSVERLVPGLDLVRLTVEIMRPIPMSGFRVEAEVRKPGRVAVLSTVRLSDDERVYAEATGLSLRENRNDEIPTVAVDSPRFEDAVPGDFPIKVTAHGEQAFPSSLEVRYDPAFSQGDGGRTRMWARSIPMLADEEPSGFQKLCPLADSGNGISFNAPTTDMAFINPDLTLSVHRTPSGEWFCTDTVSHWHTSGLGRADAQLFDVDGPVGRAMQNLIVSAPGFG